MHGARPPCHWKRQIGGPWREGNSAIPRDHIAVFAAEGLVPAGEINDPEAHGAQRNIGRLVDSLLVRTAVDQRPDGVLNTVWAYAMEPMRETSDSAQSVTPLRQK